MKTKSISEFLRAYTFYIGVGILTLILIIVFSRNKFGNPIEEGGKSLASFYASTLKPLIFTNEITNEDVFNFAMFKFLPVNKKENKILFVSQNEFGANSISVNNAEYKESNQGYDDFVKRMGLNDKEKAGLDSILAYHKMRLYSTILSGDNNTIAINKNIPVIRDIIFADIMNYANKVNFNKARNIYTGNNQMVNPEDLRRFDSSFYDNNKPQDYFILDKDSTYTANFSVDMPKIMYRKGIDDQQMREQFDRARFFPGNGNVRNLERDKMAFKRYNPMRDDKSIQVMIPSDSIPKDYEKVMSQLKNLPKLKNVFRIEMPNGKSTEIKMNIDVSKLMDYALQAVPPAEREKVKRAIDSAMKANGNMNIEQLKQLSKYKMQNKQE